jgi:Flp pilus assembly protein TadG
VLRLLHRLRAFARDDRAVAATEFAMILPVMVLLYAGVVDLNRAAIEGRKVETVSDTIADLVSRQPTQNQLSPASIAAILASATAIMAPYPTSGLGMTVTAVSLTPRVGGACCDATVLWSYAQGGALRPCGSRLAQRPASAPPTPSTIPAAMVATTMLGPYTSATMVIADVHDIYKPLFGQVMAALTGGMDRTTYALARGAGVLNVTQPFAGAANATTCG